MSKPALLAGFVLAFFASQGHATKPTPEKSPAAIIMASTACILITKSPTTDPNYLNCLTAKHNQVKSGINRILSNQELKHRQQIVNTRGLDFEVLKSKCAPMQSEGAYQLKTCEMQADVAYLNYLMQRER